MEDKERQHQRLKISSKHRAQIEMKAPAWQGKVLYTFNPALFKL